MSDRTEKTTLTLEDISHFAKRFIFAPRENLYTRFEITYLYLQSRLRYNGEESGYYEPVVAFLSETRVGRSGSDHVAQLENLADGVSVGKDMRHTERTLGSSFSPVCLGDWSHRRETQSQNPGVEAIEDDERR